MSAIHSTLHHFLNLLAQPFSTIKLFAMLIAIAFSHIMMQSSVAQVDKEFIPAPSPGLVVSRTESGYALSTTRSLGGPQGVFYTTHRPIEALRTTDFAQTIPTSPPTVLALWNERNADSTLVACRAIIDESVSLSPGASWIATFALIPEPGDDLKATLVFADPAGDPAAGASIVNKLNLRLVSPTGQTYWGNSGLHDGNWTTATGMRDKINTVENVFIRYGSPQWEAGLWTAEVRLWSLSADGNIDSPDTGPTSWDADFALVVTGIAPFFSRQPGDWNHDDKIDSHDIHHFINDFFAGDADFDRDGFTSVKDIFEFLSIVLQSV